MGLGDEDLAFEVIDAGRPAGEDEVLESEEGGLPDWQGKGGVGGEGEERVRELLVEVEALCGVSAMGSHPD